MWIRIGFFFFLFSICSIGGQPMMGARVYAHPHVFIITRLTIVFDDSGLAGIRTSWRFDEYFSEMIKSDFDSNRNGKIEPNENRRIEKEAFRNLANYNYFTFIKVNGNPFETKFVTDFQSVIDKNKLVYQFLIPCHVKASDSFKEIRVAIYDPSYYTAVYFAEHTTITLEKPDGFDVKYRVAENKAEAYYEGMVHPWELTLSFRIEAAN